MKDAGEGGERLIPQNFESGVFLSRKDFSFIEKE
jgi:hypothetical protein